MKTATADESWNQAQIDLAFWAMAKCFVSHTHAPSEATNHRPT